jgi:hypothetical protein
MFVMTMGMAVTVRVVIIVPVSMVLPELVVISVSFVVAPAVVASLPPSAAPIDPRIGWPHPASWTPDIAAFLGS